MSFVKQSRKTAPAIHKERSEDGFVLFLYFVQYFFFLLGVLAVALGGFTRETIIH